MPYSEVFTVIFNEDHRAPPDDAQIAPARDPVHSDQTASRALAPVDEDRGKPYVDVVLTALPAAARNYLEALMTTRTYEYQSDFARRYFFEGKAEGEAKGEATASARGAGCSQDRRFRRTPRSGSLAVPTPSSSRSWIRRAVTAESVDDLFD